MENIVNALKVEFARENRRVFFLQAPEKMSVITRYRYYAGDRKAGFDCNSVQKAVV